MHELKAEGLVKKYGSKTVVNGVSLNIKSGEVVGLLGPNGAGKTTSFYMTLGLLGADKGKIYLDNKDISRAPLFKRALMGIGYLPQEPSAFRKLNVRQNLELVLEAWPLATMEVENRIRTTLKALGIEHLGETKAIKLSGGERRRLEIARCLCIQPSFILLDEPFAGIDPIAVNDIQAIIKDLKKRGIGLLITDHNVRETLGICDRVYLIMNGVIEADGKPNEIIRNKKAKKFYLGEGFKL